MRLKIFTLFLAIQILSFAVWNAFIDKPVMAAQNIELTSVTAHASAEEYRVMPEFSVRHFNSQLNSRNKLFKEQIKNTLNHRYLMWLRSKILFWIMIKMHIAVLEEITLLFCVV